MRRKLWWCSIPIFGALVVVIIVLCVTMHDKAVPIYVVSESSVSDEITRIVSDGTYLYTELSTGVYSDKRLPVTEDLEPAISLNSGDSYSLEEVEPNTFYCKLDEVCAYMGALTDNGYREEERYRDSKTLDYKFYNGNTHVRVIWTVNGVCRIFALDSRNNVVALPYINEEEKA